MSDFSEADLCAMKRCRLIGIDGDQGAGKSELARSLQKPLAATHVELDSYMEGPPGAPYLAQLNYRRLAADLSVLANTSTIVEGVMLLDALERVDRRPEFLIFARCIIAGAWPYQAHLKPGAKPPHAALTQQIVAYYQRCRPFDQAHREVIRSI